MTCKTKAAAAAAALLMAMVSSWSVAKLPPPSDEAKAKAAEAAAKTAHGNAVGTYQLCMSMERVAATYQADAKKAGKDVKPPVETPPCKDPGPFVYSAPAPASAPAAPPLEAAGAHSPAKTATAPPSSKTPQAEQAPKKQ